MKKIFVTLFLVMCTTIISTHLSYATSTQTSTNIQPQDCRYVDNVEVIIHYSGDTFHVSARNYNDYRVSVHYQVTADYGSYQKTADSGILSIDAYSGNGAVPCKSGPLKKLEEGATYYLSVIKPYVCK